MTFDWKEFLDLAKYLRDNESSLRCSRESALRTSISRAYYAAYCTARKYAEVRLNFNSSFEKSRDHINLVKYYKDKNMRQISINLDRTRKWRNQCDYDDSVENIEVLADRVIANAEFILSKTSKY